VESSSAARCPTAAYQLAGSKKLQQQLAAPGEVERFVGAADGAALRQLFAGAAQGGAGAGGRARQPRCAARSARAVTGQLCKAAPTSPRPSPPHARPLAPGLWSLDDPAAPETAAVIAGALAHPERYVLKPQREGGGNNLYGAELVARLEEVGGAGSPRLIRPREMLPQTRLPVRWRGACRRRGRLAPSKPAAPKTRTLPRSQPLTSPHPQGGPGLGAFILMQRILPPPQRSVLARQGAWSEEETLSELGIYGTFLRRGQQVGGGGAAREVSAGLCEPECTAAADGRGRGALGGRHAPRRLS
jgi:hypothetical protein